MNRPEEVATALCSPCFSNPNRTNITNVVAVFSTPQTNICYPVHCLWGELVPCAVFVFVLSVSFGDGVVFISPLMGMWR